jgi:hypothetical protein
MNRLDGGPYNSRIVTDCVDELGFFAVKNDFRVGEITGFSPSIALSRDRWRRFGRGTVDDVPSTNLPEISPQTRQPLRIVGIG